MTARLIAPLATALVAAFLLALGPARPAQPLLRATAGGDMRLHSDRDGRAVLSTSSLRPGGSAEGTLTLANRAGAPQHLTLSMHGLADTPGRLGGVLSERLDLVVERDGDAVYTGKLADLEPLDLGELAPGASVPFRFAVSLPEEGPAIDDAYAGARVRVAWSWRGDVDGVAPETPADVAPAEDRTAPLPDVDRSEGPAAAARDVRLWLGGRRSQRTGKRGRFAVPVRCRPACSIEATAYVRARGKRIARLSLRRAGVGSAIMSLDFRVSRRVRAALRGGPLTVSVRILAHAPGHGTAAKTRSLRLRR